MILIISGVIFITVVTFTGFSLYVPVLEPADMPPQSDTLPTIISHTAEPVTLAQEPIDAPYSDPVSFHDAIMRHNMFAMDMYRQISVDPNQTDANIFFSPFSMYTAFSFLYEGAQSETATQMEHVFGFYSDTKARHEHITQTTSSINRNDSYATLETANALWLRNEFVPYDMYTDIVRDIYLADIETLDFNDAQASAMRVNDWAANKTHDKIKDVVSDDAFTDKTLALLNNAIYFKGTWVKQFDPNDTQKDTFWSNDTTTVKTDFMHNQAFFNYTKSDDIQILKMPYEGDRLSMLVILPSERDGILQLERAISAEMMNTWQQQLQPTKVTVSMPKFTANTAYSLKDYLVNLGMPDTFHPKNANFSGIMKINSLYGDTLHVSAAYQKAFVDVNEEGTEAAAVTTVILTAADSLEPEPIHFTADHPFIFVIQDDESDTILFMGRLSYPMT